MTRRSKTQKRHHEQDGMGMFDYFFGSSDQANEQNPAIPAVTPQEQVPAVTPQEQAIAPGKRKSRSRSNRRRRSLRKKTRGRGRKH